MRDKEVYLFLHPAVSEVVFYTHDSITHSYTMRISWRTRQKLYEKIKLQFHLRLKQTE